MTTIIIPAHNEQKQIKNCLTPFIDFVGLDNLEIIVVCNGCTDSTAKIVQSLSDKFICLETPIPSKTKALNLGDEYAHSFPRIYLDADIVISLEAVYSMCAALSADNQATSLEPKMSLSKSSWCVKAFYDIWLALPYCKMGMIGSGVYTLSKEGRVKFDKFPDIIADDGYVRCLFKDNERLTTKGHFSIITAPRDIYSLIKIKTRSRLGRYELKDKFPELLSNEAKDFKGAMRDLAFDYSRWHKLIVYLMINVISRIRAKWQYRTKQIVWERDGSNKDG